MSKGQGAGCCVPFGDRAANPEHGVQDTPTVAASPPNIGLIAMSITAKEAEDKLIAARVQLLVENPFFGTLATNMSLIPAEDMDGYGIGADIHGNFYFTCDFVDRHPVQDLKFAIGHIVMHLMCHHLTRRGNRNIKLWGAAVDFAANGLLIGSGFPIPKGVKYNNAFDNMTAEEIYEKLRTQSKEDEDGDGEGDGDDGQSPPGRGKSPPKDGKGKGDNKGDGDFDKHISSDLQSESERHRMEKKWEDEAIKSAILAKQRGKFPGNMDEYIKALLEVKQDWQSILWQFVNSSARNDYRMTPPNKKFLCSGFVLPSMKSDAIEFAIAVDSSGSIDSDMLKKFLSNGQAMLDLNMSMTLHYYVCDAELHKYVEYHNGDDIDRKVPGRGGTDFRPVFSDIEDKQHNISCLVFLTDTQGAFPDREPPYPVLWLVPKEAKKWGECKVPFGDLVWMED